VWIPREIWLSRELTLQEKVFLVEIDSLDNEQGCYASNKYFADFFKLSKGRCSQIISSLESKGFITTTNIYAADKTIEKRIIKVVNKLTRGSKFPKDPYLENDKENNTSISNTNIYTLFEIWNQQKIIRHKKLNEQMKRHTNARLEEYSLEELTKAISNYGKIVNEEKYYWTHKWTFGEFMKPSNVVRFLDEADPFNNFKKKTFEQAKKEVMATTEDLFKSDNVE